MKFKDKTPARLAHLDALLDQTRRLVNRRADAFDDAEAAWRRRRDARWRREPSRG